MNHVGIVVLNWNQPKLTIDTITSLLKIKHQNFNFSIYIVDNSSTDSSLSLFNKKYSKNSAISIISTKSNLGYVGGNNLGIKKALSNHCDHILIINNDVLVDPDFLQNLYEFSSNNKRIGILGPKIYFAKGREFHLNRYSPHQLGKIIWSAGGTIDWKNVLGSNIGVDEYDHGQYEQINFNVDFLSGCCLFIASEVFFTIGLFNENYFMYLEDVDFCLKTKQAGYQIAYLPTSQIWHLNAGSSGSGSQLHDYYITRNRLLFGFRYANFRAKFALFRESIKFVLSQNLIKRRAVLDFYSGHLGKASNI